jgi:hypothetical protein
LERGEVTRIGTCALAAIVTVLTPSGIDTAAGPLTARPLNGPAFSEVAHPGTPYFAEHRYRIVGKLRLALFWAGRDDVGAARMTWRSDGKSTALSLLVGSEPERAPRNLNQWGYLREELHGSRAQVFALRSLDDSGSTQDDSALAVGRGPGFGLSCSSMADIEVRNVATIVQAHGVTYRMFGRVLDAIATSQRWTVGRATRPSGADAGFLAALQHAMRVGVGVPTSARTTEPVAYVYNTTIYDLAIRSRDLLGPTTIGTRSFGRLIRTGFSIRNRTTREVTKLAVTYTQDKSILLPVQIFYQPTFWLSIELRLDDDIDAPADPAADESMLARIRGICGSAAMATRLDRE